MKQKTLTERILEARRKNKMKQTILKIEFGGEFHINDPDIITTLEKWVVPMRDVMYSSRRLKEGDSVWVFYRDSTGQLIKDNKGARIYLYTLDNGMRLCVKEGWEEKYMSGEQIDSRSWNHVELVNKSSEIQFEILAGRIYHWFVELPEDTSDEGDDE